MTRYKQSNINWRRVWLHVKIMCLSLWIENVPKWFIVHHKDWDKKNNDINNLTMISITEHNNIHSHPAWNIGINTPQETILKQQDERRKFYLPVFEEAYEMFRSWMSVIEISRKLLKNRATIYNRIKRYEQFIIGRKNEDVSSDLLQ